MVFSNYSDVPLNLYLKSDQLLPDYLPSKNPGLEIRNELDLTQLSEHLLAVIQETMQSAHISPWLRKTESEGKSRRNVE